MQTYILWISCFFSSDCYFIDCVERARIHRALDASHDLDKVPNMMIPYQTKGTLGCKSQTDKANVQGNPNKPLYRLVFDIKSHFKAMSNCLFKFSIYTADLWPRQTIILVFSQPTGQLLPQKFKGWSLSSDESSPEVLSELIKFWCY